MFVVTVHCGSAHVRGTARRYPYYIASLFETHICKTGKVIFKNTGINTYPRRSMSLAKKEGIDLAVKNNALFIDRYGSLHNKPAPELTTVECIQECTKEDFQ